MFRHLCIYFTGVVTYYSVVFCFEVIVSFAVQVMCLALLDFVTKRIIIIRFVTKSNNSLVFMLQFAFILKFCSKQVTQSQLLKT